MTCNTRHAAGDYEIPLSKGETFPPCIQRLCDGRKRAWVERRNTPAANGATCRTAARIPRWGSESGDTILTRFHEALSEEPLRLSQLVRGARVRRFIWICRPASRDRIRVCPQRDGYVPYGSKRPRSAHSNVSLDWRDRPVPQGQLGRA
jgi:hypothetical protein